MHTTQHKLETFIPAKLQELFGRLQVITSKFSRFTTEALVLINSLSYSHSTKTGSQRVSAMLNYTKQALSEQFNSYFWMIFLGIPYFLLKNFLSSKCLQRSSVKLKPALPFHSFCAFLRESNITAQTTGNALIILHLGSKQNFLYSLTLNGINNA